VNIIPSLYIRDGKTLALATGGTLFDNDPVGMAEKLTSVGCEYLYLLDLNVPPAGTSPNLQIIEDIIKKTGLKLQITGNIRSADVVERYINAGVERVILGLVAYQKPDFLKSICQKFPGKIAMPIDVVGGKVKIKGWTVAARKTALDYSEQFKDAGVSTIIYSDVETEGKITKADINHIREFYRDSPLTVIHATDVGTAEELELVLGLESVKVIGTIIGKSMYSGIVDISSTITHAKEEGSSEMDESTLIQE